MKQRSDEIYRKIIKCAGYDDKELKSRSRKRASVDKRIVVSCVMLDLGCSQSGIARMLNRTVMAPRLSYFPLRMYVQREIDRIKTIICKEPK